MITLPIAGRGGTCTIDPRTIRPGNVVASTQVANARIESRNRGAQGDAITPLYHAERLSEKVGARVLLKREDLNHTGSHKINNVLGQALLAAPKKYSLRCQRLHSVFQHVA